MPFDRRDLLRGLTGSAALAGLGGVRTFRDLLRAVDGDPVGGPMARVTDLAPSGDGDRLTRPARARRPFTMLAAQLPPGAQAQVRASADGERFGPWLPLRPNDTEREGPDGAEARAATNAWMRRTTPVWTGPARWVQLELHAARPDEVELVTTDTAADPVDAAAARLAGGGRLPPAGASPDELADATLPVSSGLRIVSRAEWGADESWRGEPTYADRVLHGVVHHTAGTNDYRPEDGPRIVRGIYRFHVHDNGWKDIGYNLLVDRFGVVYEGRYGGLDLPVIGAHAMGANTGSFGVAVIGDFRWEELAWPEPRNALFEVLAWKFGLHAIDPQATVTTAGGRSGVPTLAGHRDTGSTECPGEKVHTLLPEWRRGLASRVPGALTDVDGHPHEDAIRRLREAGITTGFGDGTFRPDRTVTRGQMATFLTRAAQLPPGEPGPFPDVPAEHAHHDGIAAAAAAGIAGGRRDGTFAPGDPVTRGQMASFLMRAVGLEPRSGETFPDVDPADTHHGAIEAVAAAKIAQGYRDGTFRPADLVTRGQMASFLARAFELPPLGEGPSDGDDLEDPEEDEIDDPDEHQPTHGEGGGTRTV